MRRMLMIIVLFLSPGLAGESRAAEADNKTYTPLSAEDYHRLLPGHTLIGEYRFLRERTKTFNFTEAHHADGTTDYREGPIRAKGVWYTLGKHKVCYKYPNQPDMGDGISCFWVYNQNGCYYGYSFDSMTLHGPRRFEDWTARWVIKGSGKSCDEAIG